VLKAISCFSVELYMYQQGKIHLTLSYSYSTRSWETIDLFSGFPIPDLSFQGYPEVPANRQTTPRLRSLLQGRAKCVKACLRHQLAFSGMLKRYLLPSVHRSLATRSPRHSMGGRTESSTTDVDSELYARTGSA
jgi:hypothetical protein